MPDNNDSTKKTFDVTPPNVLNSQAASTAPKVIVKTDPMLTIPPSNDLSAPSDLSETKTEPDNSDQQPIISTAKKTLTPISENLNEESQDNQIDQNDSSQEVNEDFVSTDAVPDAPSSNDLANADKAKAMQQPKIFDTNEYFVPIHETTHKHGFVKGSLVAGFVAAIIVLVAVAVMAFWVSK